MSVRAVEEKVSDIRKSQGERGPRRLEPPRQSVEQRNAVQQVERAREHAPSMSREEQERERHFCDD